MQVVDAVDRELHRLIEENAPLMSTIRGPQPEVAGAPLVVAGDTRRGSVRGVVRGAQRRCTVAGVLGYAPRPSAHPRRRPPAESLWRSGPAADDQRAGVVPFVCATSKAPSHVAVDDHEPCVRRSPPRRGKSMAPGGLGRSRSCLRFRGALATIRTNGRNHLPRTLACNFVP